MKAQTLPTGHDITYQANDLCFRIARPSDGDTLQKILGENPMSSWVKLRFERRPDYFAADHLMGQTITMIAERLLDINETIGMYSCSWMPLFIDGRPLQVPYLGSLRVNPGYRHKIRILKHGFRSLRTLLPLEDAPFLFTSIANENSGARRLLEANLNGMPKYRPLGEMCTLAIPVTKATTNGLLRPATKVDVAEIVAFYNTHSARYQFSPVLTEEWLLALNGSNGLHLHDFLIYREGAGDEGSIEACMALWDQRALKQTVVHGYRFPVNLLRPFHNALSSIMGRVQLPSSGEALQQIYLSFLALDAGIPFAPIELLRDGLFHVKKRGGELAVLGLSQNNPLLEELLDAFPCHLYRSQIELVMLNENAQSKLSSRHPQPEVALL